MRKEVKINKDSLSNSIISGNIYLRVMILACVDAVLTLPISIKEFAFSLAPPPTTFYSGWNEVHANFSAIPIFPAGEWNTDTSSKIDVVKNLWCNPFVALIFFVVFGMTKEARTTYRKLFWMTMELFGLKEPPSRDPVLSDIRFDPATNTNVAICSTLSR